MKSYRLIPPLHPQIFLHSQGKNIEGKNSSSSPKINISAKFKNWLEMNKTQNFLPEIYHYSYDFSKKSIILIVKVRQNNSVIAVTRFFRYSVNKILRRRPFFRYSSCFRYLGFRYSSRYLYLLIWK